MTQKVKLTKERIMTALENEGATYRPISSPNKRFESPFQARERLLKLADKVENGKLEKVDVSIAFDKCKEVSMSQLSYAEKVAELKKISNPNFTNRTMLMLTGAEDFLTQEKYKDKRYYIDMVYDIAMPELAANPEKPSKALTALAFNGALRPEDYQKLVDAGKQASAAELKEFLTQEVDHEPKEKVVNYLSFPMLAMMTQHVKPWEAVDILLLAPNLIKDCFSNTRSKTFKELMSENTYLLLRQKAPKELQEHLKIDDAILTSWGVSLDATNKEGKLVSSHLDRRTVQAVARWDDIRKARTAAHQTGTAAKIQQWLQNNRVHS